MSAADTKNRVEDELKKTVGRALPGHSDPRFLAHALTPVNVGFIPRCSGKATGVGSCGDSMEVTLSVAQGRIMDIRVMPNGCLHTVACASAMSELVKGRDLEEALEVGPEHLEAALGGLPHDHQHCARLAINTLGEAVEDYYRRRNLDPG